MESNSNNILCKDFIELLNQDSIVYINRRARVIRLDSRESEPYHFTDIEFYKVLMYFIENNIETF